MPILEIIVSIKRDGQLLANYPKIRRFSVDESQAFQYEQANQGAGTYAALPLDQLDIIQALVLRFV